MSKTGADSKQFPWRFFRIVAATDCLYILGAVVLGALTIGANIGLLTTSAWLIAMAALQPPMAVLAVAIVGVRFFGLARSVLRYGERYVGHEVTFRLLSRLRVWFYQAVEPGFPSASVGVTAAELASNLSADVETLKFFYLRVLLPVLAALLVVLGTGLWLWQMTAAVLLWPLALLVFANGMILPVWVFRRGRQADEVYQNLRIKLQDSLADSLEGLSDLTLCQQTEKQIMLLSKMDKETTSARLRLRRCIATANACGRLGLDAAVVLAVLLASFLVQQGELAGVLLPVTALAVQGLSEAMLPLAAAGHYLLESRTAWQRLFAEKTESNFETVSAVPVFISAVVPDSSNISNSPSIKVTGLYFRYSLQVPLVLHDINFSLQSGKRLAIVGPSGAGKSTLAALLLGLWQAESGNIFIAEQNIVDWSTEKVRECFGVVSQDTYIFAASLADNIRLALPTATEQQLQAAAAAAGLANWAMSLPQGYDTIVGQYGRTLSGGERQRVALARVVLKNAPILLLDEPYAALDSLTSRQISSRLNSIMKGRTTILITHRLLGLEEMDKIIVLDQGKLAEQGKMQELLAAGNLFSRLWLAEQEQLQFTES